MTAEFCPLAWPVLTKTGHEEPNSGATCLWVLMTLRGGHGKLEPWLCRHTPIPSLSWGLPTCATAGGRESREQACFTPDAPDQAQPTVGFKELSEYPTQAIPVESSMDASCPETGNVPVSTSLPGVRMGPGDPGIHVVTHLDVTEGSVTQP